jgi:hypothetical protein
MPHLLENRLAIDSSSWWQPIFTFAFAVEVSLHTVFSTHKQCYSILHDEHNTDGTVQLLLLYWKSERALGSLFLCLQCFDEAGAVHRCTKSVLAVP